MMEKKSKTAPTSIKVPDMILKWIDTDVEESGEYTSRNDWIMSAIRNYIDLRRSRTTSEVSLDELRVKKEN